VRIFRNCDPRSLVSVHRANFFTTEYSDHTEKENRVLPSPHALVFIPCVQCVPWLTTEPIFYHGILGPHGKREQVLPSPHALVFISVCSVCSVVDHRANFFTTEYSDHTKKENRVLPSPHALVCIPCIRCVPWLTTEQIFYHGILGPHGKREQVLPSPHALVFISVCSVCSVVDHRADFLPRNTRTTRKKRTGPPQSSCPGLHSVCSVCSVVTFLGLGLRRHPSRIGYAQFVVRIAGHDKQQVAQTV
jgi:hypothetical protein